LRLKGIVNRICADDLAFSEEDIPAYFRALSIALTREEVARLYEYTEGWVSALYLFALDYRRSGRFAYAASIPELVYDAVYQPLDEELKDFLLAVSPFDAFGPEEASHVWPKGNSAALIDRLMSANTFIARSGETGSYSLHRILGLCVQERFQLLPEQARKGRLRAAGEAMHRAGRHMAALSCFERAEDFDGILRIIGDSAHACDLYPEHRELYIRCYLSCPPEVRAKYPLASLLFGMDMITQFHEPALYEQAKADFLRALAEASEIGPEERDQLLGEYEMLLGFGAFNDVITMGLQNLRAAALIKKPPRFVFTKDSFTFASPSFLCLYHRSPGALAALEEYLAPARRSYSKITDGQGQGFVPIILAERLYALGEAEAALAEARRGTEIARATEQGDIEVCGLFLLARLALLGGDYAAIRENLLRISGLSRRLSREHGAYWLLYTSELCAAWIDLSLIGGAPDWIVGREYTRYLPHVAVSCADVVLVCALMERGEWERLLALNDVLLEQAGIYPNTLAEIYIRIGMAAALGKLGRPAAAAEALKKALAIAEPDGLVMPFAETMAHIAPAMNEMPEDAASAPFLRRVKELAATYAASKRAIRLARQAERAPALSPRERQIGQLAAAGYTNARIAQALNISSNTVKTEMKALFSKLNIGSRALLKREMFEK
jgi:LuxR family maltose regulon positive regulatory protein